MINNYAPQPYPLWLLTEDTTGQLAPTLGLVIGWHPDQTGRLFAVVADGATAMAAVPHEDRRHTLYLSEHDAAAAHRQACDTPG